MGDSHFFSIPIEDPEITKLSIQMTAIHGDPDMFVSSKTPSPSIWDYEKRSTNSGIFPDIIEFELYNSTSTTYTVLVKGWVDSKYSIVYFTHTNNGTIGIQKLLVGKKQQGTIHPNATASKTSEQPSLLYHFKVSRQMLDSDKEIEVRLNADHGNFIYIVQQGSIPELTNYGLTLKKG